MAVVQHIKEMICSIVPLHKKEEEQLVFTKNWMESGAGIFRISKPSTPDPHLVAYFLLLDLKTRKLLLVDHKKSGLWFPAGGHVELDEYPKKTVERECLEELGNRAEFLHADPFFLTVSLTAGPTAGHTDVSLWYVLKGCSEESYQFAPAEFNQISWCAPEDIPAHKAEPHMQRCIKKLKMMHLL